MSTSENPPSMFNRINTPTGNILLASMFSENNFIHVEALEERKYDNS